MSLYPIQQRPSFQYASPLFQPPHHEMPIPPRNDVELTRERLIDVLNYFSQVVLGPFNGHPIRLVVHGGACMLLHPGLHSLSQQQKQLSPTMQRRYTTRDVDIIKRSFALEWAQYGVTDATDRLDECVKATARHFRLGADWMNSDADVALPWATDPSGKTYDPIYAAAIQPNNVALHTIFASQNGLLTLISVTPFWSVALKLVRYTKWDPGDICLLLRNGTILSKTQWTPEMLENWLVMHCWTMGYAQYDAHRRNEMRLRIVDAVRLVANWTAQVVGPDKVSVTPVEAMGGGDIFPGSQGQPGWNSRMGAWPTDKHHSTPSHPRKSPAANDHRVAVNQNNPSSGSNVSEWLDTQRDRQLEPQPDEPKRRRSHHKEGFIPPDVDPSWMNLNINLNGQKIDDNPPLDERWTLINPPDPRSRPKSSNAVHRARSSEELVTSLGVMLDTRQAPWPGGFMNPNEMPVIPSMGHSKPHRKCKKKKDKTHDRNHISQWARRDVASDESSTDDELPSRRTLPVWQIYSDKPKDGAPQTQSFLVQPPRMPTSSPPPLSRAPPLSFSQSWHSQFNTYDQMHSHVPPPNLLGLYSS